MKVHVDQPGDYSFGWHIANDGALRENYNIKFTVVWYPANAKMNSKKSIGEDMGNQLVGEKECSGYEAEKTI